MLETPILAFYQSRFHEHEKSLRRVRRLDKSTWTGQARRMKRSIITPR
ncbi:hypothetical protein C1A50_4666 [Paenibacillus polymyxa]|nr:hypothetical protein C1A50_4666 [Paenibacillus polymyxa]